MPLFRSSRTVILFAKEPANKPPILHEQNGDSLFFSPSHLFVLKSQNKQVPAPSFRAHRTIPSRGSDLIAAQNGQLFLNSFFNQFI
jgi:hypothetical protein